MKRTMDQDIEEILYSEEELRRRVHALGAQISRDYEGVDNVILVSILRGSYIFMADLSRSITIPCRMDFMAVSSYGQGTSSTGSIPTAPAPTCFPGPSGRPTRSPGTRSGWPRCSRPCWPSTCG